jgi:hypothetical protein
MDNRDDHRVVLHVEWCSSMGATNREASRLPHQPNFCGKQGFLGPWPGYSLVASTIPTLTVPALAVGLSALIAVVSIYRWSGIVEELGKWVGIWRGIIVIVTSRVGGVARQAGSIVVLPKRCTGSKTEVSSPAPTRQHEG